MTARVRIMAETDTEADRVQAALEDGGLEVAGGGRDYPNRGGFGFRRYLEVRVPENGMVRARSSRDDRREIEG